MLILASASPWRATLLHEAGFDYQILPTDMDESSYMDTIKDPKTLVETLASAKAKEALRRYTLHSKLDTNPTILAADTIVWINNQIIGKPKDRLDAKKIITLLSGNTHQVWTGVCIINSTNESPFLRETGSMPSELHPTTFSEKTSVTFKPMTAKEIDTYLDTNDWVEKAGGYQIQKSIKKYIQSIDGDYDNIIGLPIKKVTPFLCDIK